MTGVLTVFTVMSLVSPDFLTLTGVLTVFSCVPGEPRLSDTDRCTHCVQLCP